MSALSIDVIKNKQEEWKRFTRLIGILFKYGFVDLLDQSGMIKWVPRAIRTSTDNESIKKLDHNQRIRKALEELGTTYIKFGQTLSNRSDILPEGLIKELEHLQDNVNPIADFDVTSYMQGFYEKPVDTIFESIENKPLAAASIAQVHKAVLNDDDRTSVVIKVRRPGIEKDIKSDLAVLKTFTELLVNNVDSIRKYRPLDLIEDFEEAILKEINFKNELNNAERFHNVFKDDQDVVVPKIHRSISNKEILVMDFVQGTKVSKIDEMGLSKAERKKIAKKGVKIFFKQIMEKGFYHADPHPGNFFILPSQQISFIDFGMMGVILPQDKDNLGDLFFAIIQKDPAEVLRMIKIMAIHADIPNEQKLQYQINDLLSKYADADLKEVDMSDLTEEIRRVLHQNEIVMPFYVFQLLRTLMIIEGIGAKLDPEFSIFDEMSKYLHKIVLNKMDPKKLLLRGVRTVRQVDRLTKDLPADLHEILTKLKKGQLQFSFEVKEKRAMERSINKVANRLVIAILIAALSIGSAMVVGTNMPPLINGIPLLGIIGFTVSGLLSVFIVITIIRRDLF